MHDGARVVASVAGRIKATRDGMQDIVITDPNAPDISGKECGNGVVIDHGDGWETQYCHLKTGSVAVANGDDVEAGDTLGLVGLSGRTAFPHVHLSVRKNGNVVDPFDPNDARSCRGSDVDLWDDRSQPNYVAGGILDAGFHDDIPEFFELKQGLINHQSLPQDAPALVIWAYLFGSQAGDGVHLRIDGPKGWTFSSKVELDRAQAELFRAGGKRKPADDWPLGTYSGDIALIRDGNLYHKRHLALEITR